MSPAAKKVVPTHVLVGFNDGLRRETSCRLQVVTDMAPPTVCNRQVDPAITVEVGGDEWLGACTSLPSDVDARPEVALRVLKVHA